MPSELSSPNAPCFRVLSIVLSVNTLGNHTEAIQLPWHSYKHHCLRMLFIFGNKKRKQKCFLSQVPIQGFCPKEVPLRSSKTQNYNKWAALNCFYSTWKKKKKSQKLSSHLATLLLQGLSNKEQIESTIKILFSILCAFCFSFVRLPHQKPKLPSLQLSRTA